MPKDIDTVWRLDYSLTPTKVVYYGGLLLHKEWLNKGLLFKTEEECQKFADHCLKYFNENS